MTVRNPDIRLVDLLNNSTNIDWSSVIAALRERDVAVTTLEPKSNDPQALDTEQVTIALLRLAVVENSPGPASIEAVLELEHTAGRLYILSLHDGNAILEAASMEALQHALETAEMVYGPDHRRTGAIQAKIALLQVARQEVDSDPGDGELKALVESVTVADLLEQLRKLEYNMTPPDKSWSDLQYPASLAVLSLSVAQEAYGHKHAGVFWQLWQFGRELRARQESLVSTGS